MPSKRQGAGSVVTALVCRIFANTACTHGRQAAQRSAIDESVIVSYGSVKSAAVSRNDVSKPQYKKTTRKSCSGVLTFLGLTNALNSRAICTVAGQGHLVFQYNPDEGQSLYRLGSQPTASCRNVRMACPPQQANRGVT